MRTCPMAPNSCFVHTQLDYNWDLVFLLRILYRDNDLFITMLNGPVEQRIPPERLGHYDHIFTFEEATMWSWTTRTPSAACSRIY